MMDNAEVLRGTLALYDWTDNEMNRRRLEAIAEVKHSEIERFERGYLLRGCTLKSPSTATALPVPGIFVCLGKCSVASLPCIPIFTCLIV